MLLTLTRAPNGMGNVTAVTDCYGRGFSHQEAAYATSNVSAPYAQSYQELTQVSQIAPSGTSATRRDGAGAVPAHDHRALADGQRHEPARTPMPNSSPTSPPAART